MEDRSYEFDMDQCIDAVGLNVNRSVVSSSGKTSLRRGVHLSMGVLPCVFGQSLAQIAVLSICDENG